MNGDKSNKSLLGSIANTLHKYRDVFYLLVIASLFFALVSMHNTQVILLSSRTQSTEPSSFFQSIDIPQVETPPAPRGTVATRMVQYSDIVEFTFFNRNGRILDVIEVDRPPWPRMELFLAVLEQRLEEMNEDTPMRVTQNDGVTVRKIDGDGNDVVFSMTTWHGRERYIQRFSAPDFVPAINI